MMHRDAFTSLLYPFKKSVIISARQFSVNYGLMVKVKAVSLHVNRHR